MEFSPDGCLLGVPGAVYQTYKGSFYSSLLFGVDNFSKPPFILQFLEPTISVTFDPNPYQKSTKNNLYQTKTNFLFMIMGPTLTCLYSTNSIEPLYLISNLHLLPLTSLRWTKDSSFAISSMDGFITFGKYSYTKEPIETTSDSEDSL